MAPILFVALFCGCTTNRLRTSIVDQSGSLTLLHYQQVLGNMAMLSAEPWALPAHANLRDGSAQIQDFGLLTASGQFGTSQGYSLLTGSPGVTGSRTVVQQWGVVPVTDDTELKLLRVAYRRALGFGDYLDDDLANDLAHEFCKQISQTDDIDIRSDPALNTTVLAKALADVNVSPGPPGRTPSALPPPAPRYPPTGNTADDKNQYLHENFRYREAFVSEINQISDALSYTRINSNDPFIVFPGELAQEMNITVYFFDRSLLEKGKTGYIPLTATAVTREARRQVKQQYEDINKIRTGWFGVGGKRDIPPDACYVGRHGDRYAWVRPDGCQELADFTLKVLDLASLIKEQTFMTVPGGPRFTPGGSGGR